MEDALFRGINSITLDSKGRVAIPRRYRERLLAEANGQLVVTVDSARCLFVYPLPEWELVERKLVQLPSLNPHTRRLQGLLMGHATDLELDSHGRILIPPPLRTFALLDRQAVLIGQGNKFELWDEARWNERRENWLEDSVDDTPLPAELETISL